jgi:hypothetical protein
VVTGDFFTRFSPFFMEGVREIYNHRRIHSRTRLSEWAAALCAYDRISEAAGTWGIKSGGAALAKACTRIFSRMGN